MTHRVESFMEIFGGDKFFFGDLDKNNYNVEAIAHSLSMQCRYGGHCKGFYSVAEHCILMADRIYRDTGETTLAFEALMHDATEAYVSDLPRPLKKRLPDYERLEGEIYFRIADKFNLPNKISSLVKEYDVRIVKDERAQVMMPSDNEWVIDKLQPLGVQVQFWPPVKAKEEFLERMKIYG